MTTGQSRTASMTSYVIKFTLAWVALSAVAATAIFHLHIDAPEATSAMIMLAAAAGIGADFARREGRAMTTLELLRLAGFGTLFCFVLGPIAFAAFFMLLTGLSLADVAQMVATADISSRTLITIAMISALVTFAVIYLAAGGFSWLTARRMHKQD